MYQNGVLNYYLYFMAGFAIQTEAYSLTEVGVKSSSHNFLYWILEHEMSDIFVHCLFSGLVIEN
jgi:hypothetical protein